MHGPRLDPLKSWSRVGLSYAGQCLASHILSTKLVGTSGTSPRICPSTSIRWADEETGSEKQSSAEGHTAQMWQNLGANQAFCSSAMGPKNAQVLGPHHPGQTPAPPPKSCIAWTSHFTSASILCNRTDTTSLMQCYGAVQEGPSRCAP